MPDPRITVCGRLAVTWGGEKLEGTLPGRQGRLLFAYLVLNREHPVRRDELVEALWADEGLPTGGEGLLAPPLSRLRKALGPGRLEGRTELSLNLGDDASIDLEAAATALERTEAGLLAGDTERAWDLALEAESILSGGLLPGLEARWIDERRVIVEEMRLKSLEAVALTGTRLGPGELARAERAARSAVEASPYRESARARLIEVMQAQGNVAEALRAYEEIRVLLREELGTFPAPELTALHEKLLNAGDSGPGTVIRPRSGTAALHPAEAGPAPTAAIGEQIDPRIGRIGLVGRTQILGRLEEELELSVAGDLRIVLIAGEGGVGKTRLAAELAASRDDISVLYGRCEPGEVRPFRIWTGLLRTAMAQMDDREREVIVGGDATVLSRILPELVKGMDVDPAGPPADLEAERQALFDAVIRVIGRLTARRPLLIILDDLHWADRSTLLLLSSLAGDNPPAGVLALGTYRDDELPDDSPLLATVANIQRHRPAVRLKVESLDTDAVRRLIRNRVDEGLAGRLHDQTGGNPFFIEQIVRHMEETGGTDPAVPSEIRDIIRQRVARLPDGGPDLLSRASLIGRDFDLEILLATTRETEDRVIELLDSAVRAGLLDESPSVPGRYTFVHALLRSTLDQELSLTRRTRIHRSVGEAIEHRVVNRPVLADDLAGDLAWHFGQAGPNEADRATLYATRAAEVAAGRLAYDEAVGFYAAAIDACRSDEPVDHGVLAKLLISKAEAEWRMGELRLAGGTFFEAADAARLSGIPELLARAAIGTNWGSWEAFDVDRNRQLDLLEEALAELGDGDPALRSQLMGFLGHSLYLGGTSTARARELMLEARQLVDGVDDADAEFMVLNASSVLVWEPQNRPMRLEVAQRMVELAELTGEPEDMADALALRALAYLNLGRRTELDADQRQRAMLSQNLPQTRIAVTAMRAVRCFIEGHWPEGERLTMEALGSGLPQSAAVAMSDALVFIAHAQQGRLGEHTELLEMKDSFTANWETWPVWHIGMLLGRVQSGRADEVRRELDRPGVDGLDGAGGQNITYLVYCGIAGMLFAELGDSERAAKLCDLLEPHTGEWTIFGPAGSTFGPVDLLLGEMRLVAGRDEAAIETLEAAITMCDEMNSMPFGARARLALAEALERIGGDRTRVAELRKAGESTAHELGMKTWF